MKFRISYFIFNIFLLGCASGSKMMEASNDGFPDIWWQALPKDQIADWEIPPQAAKRELSQVVLSKRNDLGRFSNLQAIEFDFEGEHYGSVEGLWQALKYPENANDERFKNPDVVWPFTREQVMKLSGFEAKKAGDIASANMKKLDIKWVTYKGRRLAYSGSDQETAQHYDLILRACRAKLAADPGLADLLRRTKDLKFMADHKQKPDSPPSYRYHDIYMKLRAELK